MNAGRKLSVERMLELGRVSRSGFYRYQAEAAPEADTDMYPRDAIQRIAVENAQLRPAADHRRTAPSGLASESQASLPADA